MWKSRRASQERALPQGTLLNRVLSVHQRALVEYDTRKYNCRVYDFDANTISLTALIDERGLPIYLLPDTPIEIILQSGNAFYGFDSRVVTSRVEENAPIVVCTRPQAAQRTDRRGYFRVPVNLACAYQVNEEAERGQGRVLDISGGGICCLVNAEASVKQGDVLHIYLSLPGIEKDLSIKANVRMVNSGAMESWQRVAGEFHEINETTREKIIAFAVRRQLELIRSGHLTRE